MYLLTSDPTPFASAIPSWLLFHSLGFLLCLKALKIWPLPPFLGVGGGAYYLS